VSAQYVQKNLVVMFTDISGFTEHSKTISRDELMERLETHNRLLVPIIAHFNGNIIKTIGDAFLITFESPTNAVQCGLFMQHTLRKFNYDRQESDQIHIKVAINAGEVAVTGDDVFGDPVNVTAKIEKATNADEIYFTEAVFLSMNKAEVPSAFVKLFRPKGEQSEEIKLYKVVQDEADHIYQKIISTTTIDTEKMKERVEELSQFARRELEHYQETLDTIVEKQAKASRMSMIVTSIGVAVLAVIIIAGFLYVRSGSDRSGTMQGIASSVRSYLASGKIEAARDLVESTIAESGETPELAGLLAEITDFETTEKIKKAKALLEKGKNEQALAIISTIPPEKIDDPALKDMVASGMQNLDAKTLYAKGDCEGLKKVSGQSGVQPDADTKKLIARCDALSRAGSLVTGPPSEKRAKDAIVRLTNAFGDKTSDKRALDLLTKALGMELFERASLKGSGKAHEQIDSYRKRFINVTDWDTVEKELELGGLWFYTNDLSLQRAWGNWSNTDWSQKVKTLRVEGKNDPEFLWRVGMAMHEISKQLHYITGMGLYEIEMALEKDPSLLKRHEEEIFKKLGEWLDVREGVNVPFVRKLVTGHYYDRLKPELLKGLSAKNRYVQMNSFALIVEKGDIDEIKDVKPFFLENFGNFIEYQNMLARPQWKAVFSRSLTMDEYTEYRKLIESTLSDVKAKKGHWSVYKAAPKILSDMIADLKELQPAHTKTYMQ